MQSSGRERADNKGEETITAIPTEWPKARASNYVVQATVEGSSYKRGMEAQAG